MTGEVTSNLSVVLFVVWRNGVFLKDHSAFKVCGCSLYFRILKVKKREKSWTVCWLRCLLGAQITPPCLLCVLHNRGSQASCLSHLSPGWTQCSFNGGCIRNPVPMLSVHQEINPPRRGWQMRVTGVTLSVLNTCQPIHQTPLGTLSLHMRNPVFTQGREANRCLLQSPPVSSCIRRNKYRDPQPDNMQRVRNLVKLSPKWQSSIKPLCSGFREPCRREGRKSIRSREDDGHLGNRTI